MTKMGVQVRKKRRKPWKTVWETEGRKEKDAEICIGPKRKSGGTILPAGARKHAEAEPRFERNISYMGGEGKSANKEIMNSFRRGSINRFA